MLFYFIFLCCVLDIGNISKLFQKQNLKIMSSFNLLIISIYVSSIIFPILRSAVPFVFMGFPVILSSSFSLMEGDFGLTSSGKFMIRAALETLRFAYFVGCFSEKIVSQNLAFF